MILILAIIILLVSTVLHLVLHEAMHLLFIRIFRKIENITFKPWPHKHESRWYWGRVEATIKGDPLNKHETFFMKMAPRLWNILALVLLPCLTTFGWPWMLVWAALWIPGIVDLIVGSIGMNPESDIRKASEAYNINANVIRILQIAFVLISIMVTIGMLFAFFG